MKGTRSIIRLSTWLLCTLGALSLAAWLLAGCASEEPTPVLSPSTGQTASFEMTSLAFGQGETIPQLHTCDGPDLSPPLQWAAPPDGTRSLALIADDPDAPGGTWVHWVLYDLPPDRRELAQEVPKQERLVGGGLQGENDFGEIGYGGPCPPGGTTHRYFFKLYALDTRLELLPGATKEELLAQMSGHVLAEATLMGRYGR